MGDNAASAAWTVLEDMIAMFATGDLSGIRSVVSEHYVDHQGLGNVEIRGAAGFSDVVLAARRVFTDLHVEAVDLIAEGDRAVARIRWHGTLPSGLVVERETIDMIRVADGLAIEHWGAQLWARTSSS
jgi:hypothetical protein